MAFNPVEPIGSQSNPIRNCLFIAGNSILAPLIFFIFIFKPKIPLVIAVNKCSGKALTEMAVASFVYGVE